MKFSLVLATIERTEVLERLLNSIAIQNYKELELIVVDQNEDDRLVPILKGFEELFPMRHVRCQLGVSRARNAGIKMASGDIIAFPDDDCWYPSDLLSKVNTFFEENPAWDGLTGRCLDEHNKPSVGRPSRLAGQVSSFNLWTRATCVTMFLQKHVIIEVGFFDEELGPGSGTPWLAAEEMDYMLRALECGHRIYYDPNITVFHSPKEASYDAVALHRSFVYSLAMGRVLKMRQQSLWILCWWLARAIAGIVLSCCFLQPRRARFHLKSFQGRLKGWLMKGDNGS